MIRTKAIKEIRNFLTRVHKSYLPNIEEMRKAAQVTGLSLSTVNQATIHGKGSAVTHLVLACHGLKIKPADLPSQLPKLRKALSGQEKYSVLENKIEKALQVYSVDELIVWFELLLAKNKIEQRLKK